MTELPGGSSAALEELAQRMRGQYRTVGETVLQVLRQSILNGVFEPGEHLRQEELSRHIGVSRIPVRTALMRLEAEGLVTVQPHRGATVRTLTAERIHEIYRLRLLLETHALRAAAKSLSPGEKTVLVAEARRLDQAHEGADFLDERIAFYRRLYDAGGNPVTIGVIEQLRVSLGRHRLGIRLVVTDFSHEALAQAVRRDDVDTAERMLREHLIQVRDGMVATALPPRETTRGSRQK
ncbi:GntR family transcriptional regulator [Amycolatopsis rubida]|uniref:GntR family transcriptional regulator n=1 Tax=Amycolatopsis rubida TaxID=112413 RepID=A0ABX0BU64_9PSEU|nr:GntR family transcriptional regulator [Amycolatopsis sp. M39]MYW93552.1 GntR family transcriptional regulator [Amycolatopsis rubida]NEC58539.1 GntR family transcriptional regulator [Amycolatopsis rubida]OAP21192.1 HTH-type transcriptional regulator McbR [Amycolatopsis sp. M39]